MALFDKNERSHEKVRKVWQSQRRNLITSDYVLDETVTVMKARAGHGAAVAAGEAMLGSMKLTIEVVTDRDRAEAWGIFRDFADKLWSLTDCTSKSLVDRLGCDEVWTLDADFRQMGDRIRP